MKQHRTTPKPETHITAEEEAALSRKQSTKTLTSGTATTHHDDDNYHPHDSKQHNYWVELVRVCRLAVVAPAAACCSCCDNENPPPPNEARAIGSEGRRAISAQLAGRVVHVSVGRVDGA